jgi:hypothetical protein
MKLLRVLALLGAAALVVRMVMHRAKSQLVGMSHPAGSFGVAGSDYTDASTALDASWVDEQALRADSSIAGDGSIALDRSMRDA